MGDFDMGMRRGEDITRTEQLEPLDRLTPRPGASVDGRSLYGSKWVVVEILGSGRARLQRKSNGRRVDEHLKIEDWHLDQFDIHTTDQSRAAWSDYRKEGGHHIM